MSNVNRKHPTHKSAGKAEFGKNENAKFKVQKQKASCFEFPSSCDIVKLWFCLEHNLQKIGCGMVDVGYFQLL